MQIVELKVQVDKSQLTALEAEVKRLQNQVINFKTGVNGGGSSGSGGSNPYAKATKGADQYKKSAKEVTGLNKLIGGSLGEVAAKMAVWQVMGAAVSVPIRAMKEAVATMKQVDSELVEVRKVTQFNQQQMKELEQQAYKTASAYGESADAYLESVASFARAGYKEQSAALAELSTKTQIVGDTTADVANQFLLSTDAAYKYHGNIQQLSKVLDGANEIDNKYATSIEKIAEGMGLVAPVAAQAGIGVDELMASIGTITAVTQRSGAEAARAYRALVLNILGDTKTEVEDGATWTAGEIEGLRDVLRQYAPEAVKAAEATGDIINPMEAISGLAQSMKDGVLTEQKLMEMVTDIGGKLRTSQLLALVQNWDMYESMLSDFQNAAGSADREVENAMNSWERKMNVLKNSWTEFVSHMIETDTIKGALDGVTGAIQFLDSDLGQATIKAAAFAAAMAGLGKAVAGIGALAGLKNLMAFLSLFASEGLAAFGLFPALINPVTAAVAAVAGMGIAVKEATWTLGEQRSEVESLASDYEALYGAGSEYQQLLEKMNSGGASAMTDAERQRLTYLKDGAEQMERQLKAERERLHLMFQEQQGSMSNREAQYRDREGNMVYKTNEKEITKDEEATYKLKKAQYELEKSFLSGKSAASDYQNGISKLVSDNKELYDTLKQFDDWGLDLSDAQRQFMDLYDTMTELMNVPLEDLNVALAIESFDGLREIGDKTEVSWAKLKKTMQEAGASAEDIAGTLAQLQADDSVILVDIEAEDNASGVAETVTNAVNSVPDEHDTNFTGKSGKVVSESGTAKKKIKTVPTSWSTVFSGNTGPIAAAVARAKSLIASLTSGTGPGGGGAGSGSAGFGPKATGDIHFQGGPVLLGDELSPDGSPRPELVITPGGKAFLAGMTGPVVTSLPGGSRIFKYSDTMDVLSGQDIAGLTAYSKGNTAILNAFLNRGSAVPASSSGGTSSGGSSGSSGGGGSAGSKSSGSSSSSAAAKARAKASSGSSGKKSSGKSGGGSGGGSSEDYLKQLEDQLAVLRAQYDFLEASDAETEDLVAKSREIQGQLHVINDYLRETGGSEADIYKNSADWYKELEQIHKVQQEIYETERDLFETEVELYEHQGKSVTVQVAKLRQIQDNLHREADYLRSIGAAQADINRLSIQWWEIQEKILTIQKDLLSELDNAISKEISKARDRRDAELKVIDEQIESLKKQREVQQDQLEIEEKRKRVEEARFALENAQNERNVRYYNAATGRWEWGADARNVKSAQEELLSAEKELAEYERDQVFDKQIEELEAQRKAINDGFDSLESRWERLQETFEEPLRDIKEILWDLLATGKLTDEQVALIKGLVGDIDGYAAVISDAVTAIRTGAVATGANGQAYNITSEKGLDFINNAGAGSVMTGGDGSTWVKNADGSVTITKNGTSYATGRGSDTYTIGSEKGLDFLNSAPVGSSMVGGDGSTWVKGSDGTVTITKNGSTYTVQGSAVSEAGSSKSSSGSSKSSSGGTSSLAKTSTTSKLTSGAAKSNANYKVVATHDSGGVLGGMGGIKGTNAAEIVIPPDVADFMLRPSANSTFQQRMSELGYLYGATNRLPGSSYSTLSNNRSSNDHYGDVYTFGNITMTEGQARSTTLYDLAQKSRTLGIYRNS